MPAEIIQKKRKSLIISIKAFRKIIGSGIKIGTNRCKNFA